VCVASPEASARLLNLYDQPERTNSIFVKI